MDEPGIVGVVVEEKLVPHEVGERAEIALGISAQHQGVVPIPVLLHQRLPVRREPALHVLRGQPLRLQTVPRCPVPDGVLQGAGDDPGLLRELPLHAVEVHVHQGSIILFQDVRLEARMKKEVEVDQDLALVHAAFDAHVVVQSKPLRRPVQTTAQDCHAGGKLPRGK